VTGALCGGRGPARRSGDRAAEPCTRQARSGDRARGWTRCTPRPWQPGEGSGERKLEVRVTVPRARGRDDRLRGAPRARARREDKLIAWATRRWERATQTRRAAQPRGERIVGRRVGRETERLVRRDPVFGGDSRSGRRQRRGGWRHRADIEHACSHRAGRSRGLGQPSRRGARMVSVGRAGNRARNRRSGPR
jgi:hypothetical protein